MSRVILFLDVVSCVALAVCLVQFFRCALRWGATEGCTLADAFVSRRHGDRAAGYGLASAACAAWLATRWLA